MTGKADRPDDFLAPGGTPPAVSPQDARRAAALTEVAPVAISTVSPAGRRLAVIGGMRPELIDDWSGERRDFIQMAVILFVTAMEAFLAGAFAISMAFTKPVDPRAANPVLESPALWILLVAGLVWAVVIFNIDRYMVLGMEGLHGRSLLVPALIRVALALMIGIVMSTPLVLQIFDAEIQQELEVIKIEKAKESQTKVAEFQTARDEAQKALKDREADLAAAKTGTNLGSNKTYQDALKRYNQANEDCRDARTKATLERRGQLPKSQGGSGVSGDGSNYQNFKDEADRLCSDADQAKDDKDTAYDNSQLTPAEVTANVQRARQALDNAIRTRDAAQQALDRVIASSMSIGAGSWGLLARLEALDRLTSLSAKSSSADPSSTPAPTSPAPSAQATTVITAQTSSPTSPVPIAWLTHLAIVGLLVSIELLPVLFKTAKQWNAKPTGYEERWKDMDKAVLERTRVQERNAQAALEIQAYAPVAQAADLQHHQQAANAYMAEQIVGVQLQVMRNALRDWADEHGVDYSAEPPYKSPGSRPQPGTSEPSAADSGPTDAPTSAPDDAQPEAGATEAFGEDGGWTDMPFDDPETGGAR